MLCRHLHDPNESCFRALRHLNAYLNHTPHLGLIYHSSNTSSLRLEHYTTDEVPEKQTPSPVSLKAFSDASWGGEAIDKAKSTTGSLIYFGGALIFWTSNLQPVIAQSSAESETVAAFDTARTVIYFRQFLAELGLRQTSSTPIMEDNMAAIAQ
jgi:hypothetical protein